MPPAERGSSNSPIKDVIVDPREAGQVPIGRNPCGGVWTFWDYQAGAWQRDHGFRIDHALLSPALADRLVAAGVDKEHRGREKASDHAPMWVELRA